MTKIAVIDYGMGNLHSVSKALGRVCSKDQILVTSDPKVIKTADKVVLPGVGAIKDCLEAFSEELRSVTLELIRNKPTLAICVGMQMLLESSEENGGVKCLNILDGKTMHDAQFLTAVCASFPFDLYLNIFSNFSSRSSLQ